VNERARESDSSGGAILINWFATAEPTRKEIITQIVPRAGFKKRRPQTEAKQDGELNIKYRASHTPLFSFKECLPPHERRKIT
jgi:hypothetical protein